jgi:circadian clock protein KaiB
MAQSAWPSDKGENGDEPFIFFLYVTGASPNSSRAIRNLKAICEMYLQGRYQIQVIDIYQQPELARGENLVVVPTLVKASPLPVRWMVGDLSNRDRILVGLGLPVEIG